MAVIITKYLPDTNTQGVRVKASLAPGWGGGPNDTVTLNWSYNRNNWQNHADAADALARKLGLWGMYRRVALGNGRYVFAREHYEIETGFEAAPDVVPLAARR